MPETVELTVDGQTDPCSRGEDINFQFAGFPINGQVRSGDKTLGPKGFKVDLMSPAPQQQVLQTVETSDGGR